MAIYRYFEHCPVCLSKKIKEISRMEADRFFPEDFAIYQCQHCKEVFDYITHPDFAKEKEREEG